MTTYGMEMLFVVLCLGILAFLYIESKDLNNTFHVRDMFMEKGKASFGRFAAMLALLISSWGFVFLTLKDHLTEWFFTTYMAAWALSQLGNKLLTKAFEPKVKEKEDKENAN